MRKLLELLMGTGAEPERSTRLPFLSPKEAVILRLLVSRGEMYGLQLVETSDGELKRGTVYVTLNRMEDKGYIESRKDPTSLGMGPAKRMYNVTGLGVRVLRAWETLAASMAPETER
ncbi:PadR family transcriptional regulator [Sorangium sp. So ce1389]|uniref:PadR family transcriptional regulator n=1 Tax=Sorangium sp. So ce1389 TaxID=3133336 RepID=UPI003F5F2B7B